MVSAPLDLSTPHYLTLGAFGVVMCTCGQSPGYAVDDGSGWWLAVCDQEPRRPATAERIRCTSRARALEWVLRQHLFSWIRQDSADLVAGVQDPLPFDGV